MRAALRILTVSSILGGLEGGLLAAQEARPPTAVAAASARLIGEYLARWERVRPGVLVSRAALCDPTSECGHQVGEHRLADPVLRALQESTAGVLTEVRVSGACPPERGTSSCPVADRRQVIALSRGESADSGWRFQVGIFLADGGSGREMRLGQTFSVLLLPRPTGEGYYLRSVSKLVPH